MLKKISGIAGMLALIPILAPLAGPVALAAGGLAAGIDAGIKITTGEGDWTQIGLDMAACIPGAKMATAVTAATTTRDIAAGNFHLTDVMAAAAFGAAGRHRQGAATKGAPRENATRATGERDGAFDATGSGHAAPNPPDDGGSGGGRGPAEPRSARSASTPFSSHSFSDDGSLLRHFAKHGKEFGAHDQLEYAQLAERFRERGLAGELPVKIESTAVIRVWEQESRTIGVYDALTLRTWTFFKASSATYFDRQEGAELWPLIPRN